MLFELLKEAPLFLFFYSRSHITHKQAISLLVIVAEFMDFVKNIPMHRVPIPLIANVICLHCIRQNLTNSEQNYLNLKNEQTASGRR